METRVHLPDSEPPATIREVVAALKKQKLIAKHDKQSWGDWINLDGLQTVISIESMSGLTTSATIEQAEGEDDTFSSIIAAFRKLGWSGEDEDGSYAL
ncbi:hypothetical protein [Rubritalea profundi]|uniref:Carrier domain-containing protein n=1 Tax=Rubritalea profundi TaxID=1658618 RepID=A0A2S7U560_9BACT|nr:hypothetical protein [Rubritalea profundi]PQJ29534.1 hypothetical protein BSZ32_14225 [Rubritalea profundi]